MNKTIGKAMAAGVAGALLAGTAAQAAGPKYVFFFLGDGMSASQVQVTEAYLATVMGGNATNPANLAMNKLTMSKGAVCGMQTTYDDGSLNTDSASAGTAFACGTKTASGTIGMNTAKTQSYYSVADAAKMFGKKVGILSSVSLDHATPASYYANVPTRNYMNSIGSQLAASGFNFFGGGGLASPTGPKTGGDTTNNVWSLLADNGFSILTNKAAILALTNTPQDKVFCINPWLQDAAAMPYAIDCPPGNLTLAEMTEVAIACLQDDPEGFFLMVEGGKIDWACHANDAMATIGDMIDFDNAVAVAAAFYARFPNDTLVVVTGDHETGGMTVGNARLGYGVNYPVLTNQVCSYQWFGDNAWAAYKLANPTNGQTLATMNIADEGDGEAKALLADYFGLVWDGLNAYEKERLENAYDKALKLGSPNTSQEDSFLYGSYDPFIVTLTHLVNERAGIGWTSYAHTGVPVPVFAAGIGAWRFEGFYDNTDIAKKLATIMGYAGTLPVAK